MTTETVTHPSHYTQGGVECIDAIRAATGDGFQGYCQGNILKYVWRYRDKGGVEDLEKARVYLDWLIKSLSKPPKKFGWAKTKNRKAALLTLDEAIKHCDEKARGNDSCAFEHAQLGVWLEELRRRRIYSRYDAERKGGKAEW